MLKIEGLYDNADLHGDNAKEAVEGAETLTITQLTSGVRDQNRVNVFVNGKFSFSLDARQVVDLGVKVGKQITTEELAELQAASEFGKLYQRSLEWVLTRPRSVWETQDYLKRRQLKRAQLNRKRAHDKLKPLPEIQTSAIELVMERLIERGYVDDLRFAEYYVENRFTKKGISTKRLKMELAKKHIAGDIIDQVMQDSARNEEGELRKMIEKKRARYDDEKLLAYLVRQGFDYQLVKDTISALNQSET